MGDKFNGPVIFWSKVIGSKDYDTGHWINGWFNQNVNRMAYSGGSNDGWLVSVQQDGTIDKRPPDSPQGTFETCYLDNGNWLKYTPRTFTYRVVVFEV